MTSVFLTGSLRQSSGTRGRGMRPERINKILKLLKRALIAAVDQGLLVRCPMVLWRPLRVPKAEMRPFSKDEFRALLQSLPCIWRPYFEFAVFTGIRPGEEAALQWSDVNFERQRPVIEIRATLDPRKSGSRRPPKTRESARAVELIPQGGQCPQNATSYKGEG
jgi:integrase